MSTTRPAGGRPRFHTLGDVAEICRVNIKTARRWVEKKELIAHKLGRQWRVADDDLSAFLRLRRLG